MNHRTSNATCKPAFDSSFVSCEVKSASLLQRQLKFVTLPLWLCTQAISKVGEKLQAIQDCPFPSAKPPDCSIWKVRSEKTSKPKNTQVGIWYLSFELLSKILFLFFPSQDLPKELRHSILVTNKDRANSTEATELHKPDHLHSNRGLMATNR